MAATRRRTRWQVVLRRSGMVALGFSLLLLLLVWPLGCTNRVFPPARVTDPVEVYLVDHGRTPSLVLPSPDGSMTRYVYGDWRWYALGEQHLFNAINAMLIPSQGALGRERLYGPATIESVDEQVAVLIEHIFLLSVERSKVDALRAELEAIFAEQAETMVLNEDFQLAFVHHPDRYTYFWNSNHKVALWLRELGCEVRGPAYNSLWKVEYPAALQADEAEGP